MTTGSIRFRCNHCDARMKASLTLGGARCKCPRCAQMLIVPQVILDNSAPLVLLEAKERMALGIAGDAIQETWG